MWAITGVPFGVKGRTDVWVNYPQSDADNTTAATLLHPEVGVYVALGGGEHLTEAVSRLNQVSSGLATGDARGKGPAPAALRGYAGILPTNGRAGSKAKGRSKARKPSKKAR